ncbi:MAG: HesA/MoeB/ThiF family protein [Burkholderiales bacterium]|nr:HesA/MoeB/ThiF family protein [Burkholderiales bacterium]
MNDEQLLRYSRHILLDELGVDGQQRLLQSHALIIGAGGLGCPAALYLASAGVGAITLADHDVVDLTNLQRQIAHDMTTLGLSKVASAERRMLAINPDVHVVTLPEKLSGAALDDAVARADVVLDCTDRFAVRHDINRSCVRAGRPLVSGAAIRFDGQVSVFDTRRSLAPCYACLYPDGDDFEEERCATMGVFAPLVGMVGTMQAAEAIKLLAGVGEPLSGRLLTIDALGMNVMTLGIKRQAVCPVCATQRARRMD